MKPALRSIQHRQRGASAVELALILPMLVTLLMAPLFVAVFFWHYTVVQKAAQDGARYLATISEREMREPALAQAAGRIATEIVETELAELGSVGKAADVQVYCGPSRKCTGFTNGQLPPTVLVFVELHVQDIFGLVDTGRYGWRVTSSAEVSYVGK
jgi:cbb3-type cytochrome oxidase subunit 3